MKVAYKQNLVGKTKHFEKKGMLYTSVGRLLRIKKSSNIFLNLWLFENFVRTV